MYKFIAAVLILLAMAGLAHYLYDHSARTGLDFYLSPGECRLILQENDVTDYTFATLNRQSWAVQKRNIVYGILTLNQYRLHNGDRCYFLRYIPKKPYPADLNITIPLSLRNFKYRTVTYPDLEKTRLAWYGGGVDNGSVIEGPHNGRVGQLLPQSTVYLDYAGGSCLLSYVDVLEPQGMGVERERFDLAVPVQIQTKGISLKIPQKSNTVVEQWGILSAYPLCDWQNPDLIKLLETADFNRVRKWSFGGMKEITPGNYYPSSTGSFWLNPAQYVANGFLPLARQSRIAGDYALVSLYTAAGTQNKEGYWTSQPRSEWLFRDYGISDNFYDTRFCTDTARFLLAGYRSYPDPLFLEAARKYQAFYKLFAGSHHFETPGGGYLVWDYGNGRQPASYTHASLNHMLNEINFLYEYYKSTGDNNSLNLAKKIRTGIKDTLSLWVKPGGDLWYAYLPRQPVGKDYPQLTLDDLKLSQQLFKEVEGSSDPDFDQLIHAKESYLENNGIYTQ